MAFFDCQIVQGGASGTGIPLIVTCSEDFAGKIITATDGTTTLTKICPSTSPYTIQFDLPNTGSWTISGVIEGVTYSETIVITEYQLNLNSGFDYKTWVSRGGLDPDDYASLSAVFADEEAVRRLMLVHASADYLIDCVTDNIDDIDDFCANDTAMKWLGLCDYVCDGLTAITGVEAKLLASTYWERYLKDHVPVMTSNSAPYGTVSGSAIYQSYYLYYAFDGNPTTKYVTAQQNGRIQYEFPTPICVKAMLLTDESTYCIKTGTVKGSNDGSTWETIYTFTKSAAVTDELYIFANNDKYYKFIVLENTTSIDTHIYTLQFYGRALNVSVPVMTSNTAPFGEVSADSYYDTSYPYKAFTSSGKATIGSNADMGEHYISYNFMKKIKIKKVVASIGISTPGSSSSVSAKARIQSFNELDWIDVSDEFTVSSTNGTGSNHTVYYVDCNGNEASEIKILLYSSSKNSRFELFPLQFYGLDYSEKEFEAGTTKKWLYDHGVELETPVFSKGSATSIAPEKQDEQILLATSSSTSNYTNFSILAYASENLSSYSLLRAKIGDEFKVNNYSTGDGGEFCINTDYAADYPNGGSYYATHKIAYTAMNATDLPNNKSIDISSINQSADIVFGVIYQPDLKIALAELWLE